MTTFDVEAYVENYEFRSDEGNHTPDENERGMLIDAIHGVLSELSLAPNLDQPDRDQHVFDEIADALVEVPLTKSCREYVKAAFRAAIEIINRKRALTAQPAGEG